MITGTTRIARQIIKGSLLPFLLFVLLLLGYSYYKASIVPVISSELNQDLKKYIGTIFILSIFFVIQRMISAMLAWYHTNFIIRTKTTLDDKLFPLIRRSLKIVIWVTALVIILPLYGINISALVALLGVTSLAVALAAQDTIANIIAGFLILIDSPFEIGDKIKLPSGEKVEVLDIGTRRSTFILEDMSIIFVPNLNLIKNKIVNYTLGEKIKDEAKRGNI
jgi:MscS family membrane protein